MALWASGVGGAQGAVEVTSVSGSAFGAQVQVTLLGLPVNVGPLPSVTLPPNGGGPFTGNVINLGVPSVLSASVLDASTQGSLGVNGSSASSARVAGVAVTDVLTADVLASECQADASGVSGSSTITNGLVAGIPVAVNPAPNTTIDLGLVTVILNEQIVSSTPGSNDITVNAVHVIFNTGLLNGDVIIAQSHCDTTFAEIVTTTTSTTSTTTSTTTTTTTIPVHGRCDGHLTTIRGTDGNDNIVGTPGQDIIDSLGGDDVINGLGGDDVICAGPGNDTVTGGPGDDILYGQRGDDSLDGGAHAIADGCHGGTDTDTAINCERLTSVP